MRSVISLMLVFFFLSATIPLPAAQGTAPKAKPYLAVMDLKVDEGISQTLSKALSDKIREVIMSTGKYVLIDRGNIEVIMTEIAHGQSGCFDESCAVEAGRLLSAHFIVTGAVVKLSPQQCQISAQLTDVARAEIIKVASDTTTCDGAALTAAAENVALDIAGVPRKPGRAVINSSPAGATVYIDGEKKGVTPFSAELKPGKHKVIVAARGYQLSEQQIVVAPDSSQTLQFSLKKEKKKWYQTWWFYTTVGVVLAGGIAGAFVGGASGKSGGGAAAAPSGTITVIGPTY